MKINLYCCKNELDNSLNSFIFAVDDDSAINCIRDNYDKLFSENYNNISVGLAELLNSYVIFNLCTIDTELENNGFFNNVIITRLNNHNYYVNMLNKFLKNKESEEKINNES